MDKFIEHLTSDSRALRFADHPTAAAGKSTLLVDGISLWLIFHSFANQWIFSHWCLLAPMIWSDFQHFRISGSIVCRQLLHTFTDVMKGISPFDRNCEVWPQWMLNMFPTVICPVKEPDIGSACLLPETDTCSYREECCCGKCHTRWGEIMCRMTFSFSMMIIDHDV